MNLCQYLRDRISVVSQAKKAAETAARKAELKKLADEEAQELAAAVKKGSPATKKTPVAAPKVCACFCVWMWVCLWGSCVCGGCCVCAHTLEPRVSPA